MRLLLMMSILATSCLFLAALLFGIQNSTVVPVDYLFGVCQIPLGLSLAIATTGGFLVGACWGTLRRVARQAQE